MFMMIKNFKVNVAEICFLGALADIMKYYNKPVCESQILGLSTGIQIRYRYLECNGIWIDCINPILDFEEIKYACACFDVDLKKKIIRDKDSYIQEIKKQLFLGRPCIVEVETKWLSYYPRTVAQNNIHNITVYGLDEYENKIYIADNYIPSLGKGIYQGAVSLKEFREALIFNDTSYSNSALWVLEDGVKSLSNEEINTRKHLIPNHMFDKNDDYIRGCDALNSFEKYLLSLNTEEKIKQNSEELQKIYIQLVARGGTVTSRKLYAQYLKEEIKNCYYEKFELLAKEWKILCTTIIKAAKTCNIKVMNRVIERYRYIMRIEKDIAIEFSQKILIISPHPDDVCFALGGEISKLRGLPIYIWELFNVQDYTILQEDTDSAKRRIIAEEIDFLNRTWAVGIFENLPEASLRGYNGLKNILFHDINKISIDSQDNEIYNLIKKRMVEIIEELQPTWVGVPLGCGGHIDHILVRNAVLETLGSYKNMKIFIYEELPYATNSRWVRRAKENSIFLNHQTKEKLLDISEYVEDKRALLRIYKSQLEEKGCQDITNHAMKITEKGAAERIWIYK